MNPSPSALVASGSSSREDSPPPPARHRKRSLIDEELQSTKGRQDSAQFASKEALHSPPKNITERLNSPTKNIAENQPPAPLQLQQQSLSGDFYPSVRTLCHRLRARNSSAARSGFPGRSTTWSTRVVLSMYLPLRQRRLFHLRHILPPPRSLLRKALSRVPITSNNSGTRSSSTLAVVPGSMDLSSAPVLQKYLPSTPIEHLHDNFFRLFSVISTCDAARMQICDWVIFL
jgi:hypothetical protein